MALDVDSSFLSTDLSRFSTTPVPPVNVFDILRESWRETRVDMTLQFFLDPSERHGLGNVVIDALLRLLDGAQTVGSDGLASNFSADEHLGSLSWTIQTQVDFIDVLAVNEDLDLAVVLENKIGHHLHNRLDIYAESALAKGRVSRLLVVVLAPEKRRANEIQEKWLSRSLTYTELADEIRADPSLLDRALRPADLDQRRSLDLLQQFIEARSERSNMTDLSHEADVLEGWRSFMREQGAAVAAFEAARRRVNQMRRNRSSRLQELLAVGMETFPFEVSHESHGGTPVENWNAYYFAGPDRSVELKLTSDPEKPAIFVYFYDGRRYVNSGEEPLGLDWASSDEAIVEAFLERARQILEER